MIREGFWRNRRVFITGHTGFKGGWLAHWLTILGAKVYGYALNSSNELDFFQATNLLDKLEGSTIGDIRDLDLLKKSVLSSNPEIVIHMAAQSLVRRSYSDPLNTFSTNLIGILNLLDAIMYSENVRAVINVTTDKCYENNGAAWPFRECDPLGGRDPYSASKACAEIASASYRDSFLTDRGIHLANVRAGNVVGGGDQAQDRLIPDFYRSVRSGIKIKIRSPSSVRPWQHVLEPICGYMMLAERLFNNETKFIGPWNFGPERRDERSVQWVISKLCNSNPQMSWDIDQAEKPHEADILRLDSSKSQLVLGWFPKWNIDKTLEKTDYWYVSQLNGLDVSKITTEQINQYKEIH